MTLSRDTRPEAERVLVDLLRRMPPIQRLAMLDDMFATGRMLTLSGLRWRHPGASEDEIEAHYYRIMLGPELGERVLAVRRARRASPGGASGAHGRPAG